MDVPAASLQENVEPTSIKQVGNTPLVHLTHFRFGNEKDVLAKLEWFNPAGSLKARPASSMILAGENRGVLKKGMTIMEPTSGNTGIAIAKFARELGYKVELAVPERISSETKETLLSGGAKLLVTEDDLCPRVGPGTDQSIALAGALILNHPDQYYMPNQYENEANFLSHYRGTGPEIWEQTHGKVKTFITGIGTGGTITGVGTYLKENNSSIRVIAVQPQRNHHIQGLRNLDESEMPEILKRRYDVIDETITVSDDESFHMVNELANNENLFPGPSSGAVMAGLQKVVGSLDHGPIVVIFGDDASKYKSVYREFGVFTAEAYEKLRVNSRFNASRKTNS